MNADQLPEDIDNPEVPEFASWMSYRRFEERVKRHRRHIWNHQIDAFLQTVLQTRRDRDFEIPEGKVVWRAQLGIKYIIQKDESGEEIGEVRLGFSRSRMKPVTGHAKEGRANSSGIPVLYVGSTEQTAISEVRPWVGSEVSVAQFKLSRPLHAIDLTKGHGKSSWSGLTLKQLIGQEEPDAETKIRSVWTDIDNAFSRPVASSDEVEDYIPTRILAELFREAGYDAIVYRSHFGQNGKAGFNIAIFNLEDAHILNCAPYRVERIEVNYKEIGNRWFSSLDPSNDYKTSGSV